MRALREKSAGEQNKNGKGPAGQDQNQSDRYEEQTDESRRLLACRAKAVGCEKQDQTDHQMDHWNAREQCRQTAYDVMKDGQQLQMFQIHG